ncbi:MAG: hypothetical protein ACPHUF_16475, partial [Gammaproteobacteria bacterium]
HSSRLPAPPVQGFAVNKSPKGIAGGENQAQNEPTHNGLAFSKSKRKRGRKKRQFYLSVFRWIFQINLLSFASHLNIGRFD